MKKKKKRPKKKIDFAPQDSTIHVHNHTHEMTDHFDKGMATKSNDRIYYDQNPHQNSNAGNYPM